MGFFLTLIVPFQYYVITNSLLLANCYHVSSKLLHKTATLIQVPIRSRAFYFVRIQNFQEFAESILNCYNLQMDCHILQFEALFKTLLP